jgi:cytoskeleton-associated protein 5
MMASIASNNPGDKELEATAKYVKTIMKDWKESNLNMLKEALNVPKAMVESCERIPKRVLGTYAPYMCDKIGDIKVAKVISEVMLGFAEFMGAKFVSNQIVKYCSEAKAPANVAEGCTVLSAMIEEFGAGVLALKAVIDYGTFAAGNSNPKVRTAALKLFTNLYKHLGEAIRHFLSDIKDSTMKILEDEFKKVTPYAKGEFTPTRSAKGEAAEELKANPGAAKGGLDAALGEREDISKKLKKSIFDLFGDRDFKKRIKCVEEVEAILVDAKMRVKPDGLVVLWDLIVKGLKDGNKAV